MLTPELMLELDKIELPGMFYTDEDTDSIDGQSGIVTVVDDVLCIRSPEGIEVRFLAHELDFLVEYLATHSEYVYHEE